MEYRWTRESRRVTMFGLFIKTDERVKWNKINKIAWKVKIWVKQEKYMSELNGIWMIERDKVIEQGNVGQVWKIKERSELKINVNARK